MNGRYVIPPMESLPLIGYFPKRVEHRPDWLKADGVKAVRSASNCISSGPEGWIDHWKHNEMWLYSTEAAAESVIPDEQRPQFELHAYRMLPAVFDGGERAPLELPILQIQSLPPGYNAIGFDAVSRRSYSNTFECSPLSCNYMAQEIVTNEHCLLENLAMAEQVAQRFSVEEPEPGPYYVVEILRRTAVG
jgi:hypothetical protein